MYSPDIFSNDLYSLWNHDENSDSVKLLESNTRRTLNMAGHQQNNTNAESAEDHRRYLRSLYAPPLLAYSAEYPGADLSQLEYTMQRGNTFNTQLLTPLIQKKMENLQKIRTYGYSKIKPIGIDKTLEQIQIETMKRNAGDQTEDQSYIHAAENTDINIPDSSLIHRESSNISHSRAEVDLDAEIPNEDDNNEDDESFDDFDEPAPNNNNRGSASDVRDQLINDNDGFMAEEVEYQDDQSVNMELNSGSNILIDSGATSSVVTINNTNSGRSIETNPTTAVSNFMNDTNEVCTLPQEEDQDENRDCTGLDMVIDDN